MTLVTGLRMTCRTCGVGVTYGERLPFVHTEPRPTNVRPHYAQAVPAPRRADESTGTPRPAEEARPSISRPDAAATSHRASSKG